MITKEITKNEFWAKSVEEILKILETQQTGLTNEEALRRTKIFKENVLSTKKSRNGFLIFLEQFKNPLIGILILAGIVTLITKDYLDAGFIFLATLINAFLGFYQENKAEKSLEKLQSYLEEEVLAIRNGEEQKINIKNLTIGDIIYLSSGSKVPADCRLITETDLTVDESILTGESLPVEKNLEIYSSDTPLSERKNMVYKGTSVVEGTAKAVVVNIGQDTEFGKIASLLIETKPEATPLQKQISKLSIGISIVIAIIVVLIFTIGIINNYQLFDMFLMSVAIGVGSIPEGLPIAMTVILAVGVERLAKKNAIVKKLVAAETLGSVTTILTDKTGTLTQAKMQIVHLLPVFDNDLIFDNGNNLEDLKSLTQEQKNLLTLGLLNCEVAISHTNGTIHLEYTGKPLEVSMVKNALNWQISYKNLKNFYKPNMVLPFNSRDKFSTIFIDQNKKLNEILDEPTGNYLSFLGAPEILLSYTNINRQEYFKIMQIIDELANNGERVLAVAYKNTGSKEITNRKQVLEELNNLKFAGIISFSDPLREGVKQSLINTEKLGVNTIIVTGDHKGTAIATAKKLGWEIKNDQVIEGKNLKKISDKELPYVIKKYKIFARVSPEDKLRIAKNFKKAQEIIAMTGDGINDAPSLKEADIGIAVGDATDVTKEVADLILLDNNFKTISKAIREGRKIFLNIRKIVTYFLTDCFEEVILIGGALLFKLPLPLNALQILFINFFEDSFPAIGFAFENLDNPQKKLETKKIFDKEVRTIIFINGLILTIFLLGFYWYILNMGIDEQIAKTIIFTAIAITTSVFSLSLRSLTTSILKYNPFSNKHLNIGVLIAIVMTILAVYLKPLNMLFGTIPLPLNWFILGFTIAPLIEILIMESIKFYFRKKSAN